MILPGGKGTHEVLSEMIVNGKSYVYEPDAPTLPHGGNGIVYVCIIAYFLENMPSIIDIVARLLECI